ncbi:MAG TPA: hypothetical protein VMZ53_23305 [Kofleriaceae bacterium]|nr:hypothetical protein [Kofleriaceae bacterium]
MRVVVLVLLLTATASADDAWSPIDSRGWPTGVGLDELRELHTCEPGELEPSEGGAIGCRPAFVSEGPRIGMSVGWSSGPAFGSERVAGGTHALGVELDYAITRHLQLSGLYELAGIAPSRMATGDGKRSQHFFALARMRLFADEVGRDAWTLGAGAGWALRAASLGDDAPIARVSIARDIGMFLDASNTVGAGIELAYERTLDADALSTVSLSYRMGFELNVREPQNLGRPAPARSTWRTITGDAYLGNALGLGVSLGLRASSVLSLQTSAGFQFGTSEFAKQHGFDDASWSLLSGPRLSLPFDEVAPYVQVQAGPAWFSTVDGPEVRGLAHAELGTRIFAGCGGTIDAGVWLRGDIETRDLTSGGLLMRLGTGPVRAHCQPSSSGAFFASRPVDPPPPPPPSPPARTDFSSSGEVVSTGGYAGGSANVYVAQPPVVIVQQPFVLEVELGVAVAGFVVQVDPRMLPLDRMRGVRGVSIELVGSASAVASFEGALRGTLDRNGVRVDAWSTVITGSPRVIARITVTP